MKRLFCSVRTRHVQSERSEQRQRLLLLSRLAFGTAEKFQGGLKVQRGKFNRINWHEMESRIQILYSSAVSLKTMKWCI